MNSPLPSVVESSSHLTTTSHAVPSMVPVFAAVVHSIPVAVNLWLTASCVHTRPQTLISVGAPLVTSKPAPLMVILVPPVVGPDPHLRKYNR